MSELSDEEIRPIVQRVVAQLMGHSTQDSTHQREPEPGKQVTQVEPAAAARKVVVIGADHGGYELKEILKKDVAALGYEVMDVGTHSKEPVDYPDQAHEVARAVSSGNAWRGIMIDGAGIGSCIVANKVPGVRAGLAYDYASAVNGREHNDTNVLTLGAGLIGVNLAKQIVTVWLSTPFGGGRHERRVNKIMIIDKLYTKWVHLMERDDEKREGLMNPDTKTVEQLVEIITREVLIAMAEQQQAAAPEGWQCKSNCAEGLCVRTCFDRAGRVVDAGAERLSSSIGMIPQDTNLAKMIDHTLLKPDATPEQIAQLCFEARKYQFASVCVNPAWVKLCAQLLEGSPVKVCTVIGFPLGATASEVKAFEAENAINQGATEIDMVINIGALKARELEIVAQDIRGVVNAAHSRGMIVKVILETVLLTDEEKTIACMLSKEAGADFVKTSTGFAGGGATVHDVALMRRVVGPEIGVKASGGVRTYEDAESMIKAGATRIGASAGVKILQGPSASKPDAAKAASGKSY